MPGNPWCVRNIDGKIPQCNNKGNLQRARKQSKIKRGEEKGDQGFETCGVHQKPPGQMVSRGSDQGRENTWAPY